MGEYKTLMCPRDTVNSLFYQRQLYISSYVWNGAVTGFDATTSKTYRIDQFKPTDILMFEADETIPDTFNNTANFPAEGFTRRHGGQPNHSGATGSQATDSHSQVATAFFDGSAKFMSAMELTKIAGGGWQGPSVGDRGPTDPTTSLPTALWCNPGSTKGLPSTFQ